MKILGLNITRDKQAADPNDERFWGNGEGYFETLTCTKPETAAKVSAIFYCTSLIADTIGSLPLRLKPNMKSIARSPLEDTLAYAPNPLQTGMEFWSEMVFTAALRGNTYAEPVITSDGMELWHLNPAYLTEEHEERAFRLQYSPPGGMTTAFNSTQIFWFCGLSAATNQPLVPWQQAKDAAEFAMALDTQGRKFFKNAARPSGFLSSATPLSKEARDKLSKQFSSGFAGALNAGKVPVLEQMSWQSASPSNTDSQFIELCRRQVLELGRYWRIPKSMIGEEAGTRASQEQQALEFVKYTIRPSVKRIEQAIAARILTPDQRVNYTPKFNLDGLLRGDSATQWKNAVMARTAGLASVNQLRTEWFGWDALDEDWADDPREPLNSNRAADTLSGGTTSPQDNTGNQ